MLSTRLACRRPSWAPQPAQPALGPARTGTSSASGPRFATRRRLVHRPPTGTRQPRHRPPREPPRAMGVPTMAQWRCLARCPAAWPRLARARLVAGCVGCQVRNPRQAARVGTGVRAAPSHAHCAPSHGLVAAAARTASVAPSRHRRMTWSPTESIPWSAYPWNRRRPRPSSPTQPARRRPSRRLPDR